MAYGLLWQPLQPPLQLPEEQAQPLGQPMHLTPFFLERQMNQAEAPRISAITARMM
jgi:hypothetical protein